MSKRALFRQIGDCQYEAPRTSRADMLGPARIFADEDILAKAAADESLDQLLNTATLPGLTGSAMAMPDCHQGYGFPIGGVVATDARTGVVSPGGVGYDINCGVRLLRTPLPEREVAAHLEALTEAIFRTCPAGVGSHGDVRLDSDEMDGALLSGARWAVERGFGRPEDLPFIEEQGACGAADPDACTPAAKKRGHDQMGTLGAGNHFIEIDTVLSVHDVAIAQAFGLAEGMTAVQIHCGSRGFGHQVCTDAVAALQKSATRYGYSLPDRQLACAPVASPEGARYLAAMAAAANFAWANRQVLTDGIRQSFKQVFAGSIKEDVGLVYDIAHNIAKMETHELDGRTVRVCVHRKGATRAFPAGHPELPDRYRPFGQPVLLPGSMGTKSYVLVGAPDAMRLSFGSTSHGAGRLLSRKSSKKANSGRDVLDKLTRQGIVVRTGSFRGLAEERPEAYKDVDQVVSVLVRAGLARIVAELRPRAVIKG